MLNKKWESVFTIFKNMERICEPLFSIQNDLTPVNGNGSKVAEIHNELLKEIEEFKKTMDFNLPADDAKLVLVPIVLYFDELILTNYFSSNPLKWQLLQEKIYNSKNGGEKFFRIVNVVLKKEKIDKFVCELYYFCLKHGFKGKYIDDEAKIKGYMEMFELRILSGIKSD